MAKKATTKKDGEFAVIATGGKQYKVTPGDVIKIERLQGSHKSGDIISFDKVLLVDNGTDTTIGMPYIKEASVEAEYIKEGHYPTVAVVKYKQKSRNIKRNGHRQLYAEIKITAIK